MNTDEMEGKVGDHVAGIPMQGPPTSTKNVFQPRTYLEMNWIQNQSLFLNIDVVLDPCAC